jgi:hypothetical protein
MGGVFDGSGVKISPFPEKLLMDGMHLTERRIRPHSVSFPQHKNLSIVICIAQIPMLENGASHLVDERINLLFRRAL